jgi:hypothetical protein
MSADQRRRVARAATAAEAFACVAAVDVLPPDRDPSDRWTLDLLVRASDAGAVPPAIHALLGRHDLGTLRSGPQGEDLFQVVAVA